MYNTASYRPAGIINIVNVNRFMSIPFNIAPARAANIPAVIVIITITDNSGVMNNVNYPCTGHIIVINIRAVNISAWRKNPIIIRHIIPTAK